MGKTFRKYVSVDISDTVDVRIESEQIVEFLRDCDAAEFKTIMSQIKQEDVAVPEGFEVHSIIDQMKVDVLLRAYNHYSLEQLLQIQKVA
jgi:hypothetical protein